MRFSARYSACGMHSLHAWSVKQTQDVPAGLGCQFFGSVEGAVLHDHLQEGARVVRVATV